MTPHLHPVDKRPITDTPICDTRLARFELNDNFGHVHALPEPHASQLELRARKVEAQLEVAEANTANWELDCLDEREALHGLEIKLAKLKCSEEQLMLVIERQDANYHSMLKEIEQLTEQNKKLAAFVLDACDIVAKLKCEGMYRLSYIDESFGVLRTVGYFPDVESATDYLFETEHTYVDIDSWTQEDRFTWTQYQFVLEKHDD